MSVPLAGVAGICSLFVGVKTINRSANQIRLMRHEDQKHQDYQRHLARTRELDLHLLEIAQNSLDNHLEVERLATGLQQTMTSSVLEGNGSVNFGGVRLRKRA